MIAVLIEAAKIMDRLFWYQAWGRDYDKWLATLGRPGPASLRRDQLWPPGIALRPTNRSSKASGPKPPGARFYPADMSVEEFEKWDEPGKRGLYTLVRRDAEGRLFLRAYRDEYRQELEKAAILLRRAADLAVDAEFADYLRLRADALLSDEFTASDLAWLDMKDNVVDVVIGPIENYEDQLFGYRTAYEAYVLLKDLDWSQSLARYATYLPELQRDLPVEEKYKAEVPGTDSDLNAYDVLYYAGHSNAGSKTIAINLPNDEEVSTPERNAAGCS